MTQFLKRAALAFAVALAGDAAAKVTDHGGGGFTVVLEGDIAAAPVDAYRRFVDIGSWWSNAHTFSGRAANMAITPEPGGCWCEALPDSGFVKHMDVAYAAPGKSLVLRGALGPILFMGADGAMTVNFEPKGEGAHVTLTYTVGGYDPAGWGELSQAVDRVLAEQFTAFLTGQQQSP